MKFPSVNKLLFILFISMTSVGFAQANSEIEGQWRTYDDNGNARSILKIYQTGNSFQGKIVKIIPLAGRDAEVCNQCQGQLHGKPLVGMVVIWGLKQQGNEWTDGSVLDVDSGKIYECSVTLGNNAKTLHFYGHLGPFGKTVDWQRVP